jgi:hypothetical protein
LPPPEGLIITQPVEKKGNRREESGEASFVKKMNKDPKKSLTIVKRRAIYTGNCKL